MHGSTGIAASKVARTFNPSRKAATRAAPAKKPMASQDGATQRLAASNQQRGSDLSGWDSDQLSIAHWYREG